MAGRSVQSLSIADLKRFREIMTSYAKWSEEVIEYMEKTGKPISTDGVSQIKKGLFSFRKILAKRVAPATLDEFPEVEGWSQHAQRANKIDVAKAKALNESKRKKN